MRGRDAVSTFRPELASTRKTARWSDVTAFTSRYTMGSTTTLSATIVLSATDLSRTVPDTTASSTAPRRFSSVAQEQKAEYEVCPWMWLFFHHPSAVYMQSRCLRKHTTTIEDQFNSDLFNCQQP